jgi:hypothetical protein
VTVASTWEWRYLRGALLALAAVLALQVGGWLAYRAVHERTPPLELTVRCLTREKLLELGPATGDPIAASAGEGWVATRIEGNGVHIAIAGSGSEAERIVELYQMVGGTLAGKLERRGRVVYLWEGVSSPTQRQTVYDCHYE